MTTTRLLSTLPRGTKKRQLAAATLVSLVGVSLATRHLRQEKLRTLTPVPSTSSSVDLPRLIETVTRAGLMGSTRSVKDELDLLRNWHRERGYHGGLVVRDVTLPLFSGKGAPIVERADQRECYYLYYEIHSNGEMRQQLFCRGTTLWADIGTCLQAWFVYDPELNCHVHHGFNQHANRILEDVLPLLAPPSTLSTVEICGHSLGGAVAMLLAIKLRKRGYSVTRVTSLAGPRICRGSKERQVLEEWLPEETIRIEHDLDGVTYLPPGGVSVGDKLWLVSEVGLWGKEKKQEAYLLKREWIQDPSGEGAWVESVWWNLRLWETILNQSLTHRLSSYVKRLEELLNSIQENDSS